MPRLRPLLAAAAALGLVLVSALPAEAGRRTGTWKYFPEGLPAYGHGYGDQGYGHGYAYGGHRGWGHHDRGDSWGYRPYRPAYAPPPVWEDDGPARWNYRRGWLAPAPVWEDDEGWN